MVFVVKFSKEAIISIKSKMKNLILVVLFLFLAIPGFAVVGQLETVKGKVIDAKTKEAMQFVNVSVRKEGSTVPLTGAVTDNQGVFQLGKLEPGTYVLNISFIGYRTFEKNFTLDSPDQNINFRIIPLEEDSQMLGEVKVVGQRSQMKFEIDKKYLMWMRIFLLPGERLVMC